MVTFSCIKRTWQKPGSFYVFEKMQDMANETGQQLKEQDKIIAGLNGIKEQVSSSHLFASFHDAWFVTLVRIQMLQSFCQSLTKKG